jgi:hypothetical protein
MPSLLPDEAADLYGLPLDGFTPARNDLAKSLKEQGKNDEAKVVRELKKPSLAAWAVNQIARGRPDGMAELLEITGRISEADDPAEMRAAVAERHRAVKALVEEAARVLEDGGHSAGPSTLQQVTRTLYAASAEDEGGRIAQGTLEKAIESTGFDAVPGLSLEAMAPEGTDESGDNERRLLEEELAEAEERAAHLDREAAKARLEADTADSEATQARRRVRELKDRLEATDS